MNGGRTLNFGSQFFWAPSKVVAVVALELGRRRLAVVFIGRFAFFFCFVFGLVFFFFRFFPATVVSLLPPKEKKKKKRKKRQRKKKEETMAKIPFRVWTLISF